jgi:site-specific DNA-methyltransferase (adenine-specific)
MTAVSEIAPVGDSFAGSDSAGEACRLSGRRCLACEIDAAIERARTRIASMLLFWDGGGA